MPVTARIEPLIIPTYGLGAPEKNPIFFERRVYQGSNGKVYPVPYIDKVCDEAQDLSYESVLLENDFVRLVLLPEIGGRILIGQDKTHGDYDFFYRQEVIKPALVGLAGPWISGGVEFNWPQHHRPGTFLPSDMHIEKEPDGARTVWLSEHDPITHLKGMHGIRLRPDSSLIELCVRLYNRTPLTQSFLWWANVAARVHAQYQSFFPPDVHYVADHAVRATASFPLADAPYYGVAYQERPGANDLTRYENIPVPTSYMVCQTAFDFFGGYDHAARAGFVHVASRHIAPGKKQWTWGKAAFGQAWDRELCDDAAPYIELMAGVYTDNQPDFSYLLPYETKTFSQYWWPIQEIGPLVQASTRAALACEIGSQGEISLGLCVPTPIAGATLRIEERGKIIAEHEIALAPGEAWQNSETRCAGDNASELTLHLFDASGQEILGYRPVDRSTLKRERDVAQAPATPSEITSCDELFLIGEHLEQYRHPTRDPEAYWQEALTRDPGDARCHMALGKRALSRGELESAVQHLRQSIGRLTQFHPNPVSGEAHYFCGLALQRLERLDEAYRLFYKATWNYEWRASSYYQLATIDGRRGEFDKAFELLEASLETDRQNNKAQVLEAIVLRKLGRVDEARCVLEALLARDPLDHWAQAELARHSGDHGALLASTRNDAQTMLDLAFDYAEAGCSAEAIELLELHQIHEVKEVAVPNPMGRTAMTLYLQAWLHDACRDSTAAAAAFGRARAQASAHFFPSRLEEMLVLEWAISKAEGEANADPLAAYALGNYYYDKRRHGDAIRVWEGAVHAGTDIPQVFRNLGIAYWKQQRDGEKAVAAYRHAIALDPRDARLVSEFDQLAAKLRRPLDERLASLESQRELALQRDDASVALADLYTLTGRPREALDLLHSRRFHPWEGGEGAVLRAYTKACLALGREALEHHNAALALEHFTSANETPASLGEAYHPLQARADLRYWRGLALKDLGRDDEAMAEFRLSAEEAGDFSAMAVIEHSPLSYYRGLSLLELGRQDEADALFHALLAFGERGLTRVAELDYFATSLPELLVFDEDLQARNDAEMHLLIALAQHALGRNDEARLHLSKSLDVVNDEQHAHDLLAELNS